MKSPKSGVKAKIWDERVEYFRTIALLIVLCSLIWFSFFGAVYNLMEPHVVHIDNAYASVSSQDAPGEFFYEYPHDIPFKPESLRDALPVIRQVAADVGVDWRMIYAIAGQESSFGKNLVGDGGNSTGWYHIYHINTCEYRETDVCIKSADRLDFWKATYWTAKRLKRHEHLGLFEMARSHNGLVENHSNDWYAENIIAAMRNADKEVSSL